MPDTIDAAWLFEHDASFYDAWGQRMDTAGLVRWSAPELPHLRSANHAAVGPDDVVIPDQLVQVFDRQQREGARRKCVDLYGAVDDRDALLDQLGLQRESSGRTVVIAWRREDTALPSFAQVGDRPVPEVDHLAADAWYDAVTAIRRDSIEDWEHDVIRYQASIDVARFYGIRIADSAVACVARYDLSHGSRVDSLFVDPDFRRTGFGRATLAAAIREAPEDRIYGTFDDKNLAMARVGERLGGAIRLRDVVRRYVGKWEDDDE